MTGAAFTCCALLINERQGGNVMTSPLHEKIDVLFVHVPKFSSYYKPIDEFMFINYIPMGVFALCDILNKKGFQSRIKHLGLEYINDEHFSIAEYVKVRSVKIVAISLHWHYQAYDVIEVARKIKEACAQSAIVLGGFTAGYFAEEIIENYPWIDCVIAGDGERGILEYANAVFEGGPLAAVSNAVYRTADGTLCNNGITYLADFADLRDIDYAGLDYLDHHVGYRDYFKVPLFWSLRMSAKENMRMKLGTASSTFPLMIGRGCNFDCSFCGGAKSAQIRFCNRRRAVLMPIEKVVDIMEQALGYGYESFILSFDPDPSDSGYFVTLFAEVRRRGLRCGMGFESWGLPDSAFIEAFAETFIKKRSYIAISPESGSESVRKKNKGYYYSNEEMFAALALIDAQKIPSVVYLTIGLPAETYKDIENNRAFARTIRKKVRHLMSIQMVPIQLEPASPIYENPSLWGVKTERSCFNDFYEYHKQPHSNPYTYTGYTTDSLVDANGSVEAFSRFISKERCQNFCIIQFKIFGKIYLPFVSRMLCRRSHCKWIKKGFGKPPEVRRTFS